MVKAAGEALPTGRKKVGAMVGDGAEVGCNSVLCPGSVLGRGAQVYPQAVCAAMCRKITFTRPQAISPAPLSAAVQGKGEIQMGRLFGTDGVRGVAGEDMTCELAMDIGRAAATVLTYGRRRRPLVVLGRIRAFRLTCWARRFPPGCAAWGRT